MLQGNAKITTHNHEASLKLNNIKQSHKIPQLFTNTDAA
jgi:hypothetical protein